MSRKKLNLCKDLKNFKYPETYPRNGSGDEGEESHGYYYQRTSPEISGYPFKGRSAAYLIEDQHGDHISQNKEQGDNHSTREIFCQGKSNDQGEQYEAVIGCNSRKNFQDFSVLCDSFWKGFQIYPFAKILKPHANQGREGEKKEIFRKTSPGMGHDKSKKHPKKKN